MSDDVVIFMSYAHDDDLILSPDLDEPGFVSFLDQQLRLKLRDLGARQANIWRDRRRISQGDHFADIIDDELSQAELLVVVMSPNWMQRPYCRKEFETFLSLRKAAGVRESSDSKSLSWARAMSIASPARLNCKGRKDSCSTHVMMRTTSARSRPSSIAASATTGSTPNSTISRADCTSA